ncbi:unnamed protein product [Boreogadus saida]
MEKKKKNDFSWEEHMFYGGICGMTYLQRKIEDKVQLENSTGPVHPDAHRVLPGRVSSRPSSLGSEERRGLFINRVPESSLCIPPAWTSGVTISSWIV